MEYIQEITLDLNADSAPPILYVKQGDDDTRKLKVHLMSDGNEYVPDNNAMVMVRAIKPDGSYYIDSTVGSIDSNIVWVTLDGGALNAAGRALVDILLYNGNQYLSTASFILKVQRSPVEAMGGSVPSNDYALFSTLLASLGDIYPSILEAVGNAQAAANAAAASASDINDNGIIITAGNVLEPGHSTPNIIVKNSKNNFSFHAPTVKPYVTATVSLVQDAEPQVAVSTISITPGTGEDSNLVAGFSFDFTLPKNTLDIAVSTTFTSNDFEKAADASYVGAALSGIIEAIPPEIYDSANYIIPTAHGGTGASTASGARSALGAQATIQTDEITLSSSTGTGAGNWNGSSGNYTQSVSINIPAGITLSAAPQFIASPNNMTSWTAAAEAALGPPTATYTSGNSWSLTFPCEDIPPASINITVYWW